MKNGMNVKLTAAPVECSCGRWYADEAGVNACQQHDHHVHTYNVNRDYNPIVALEMDITVNCTECGERLHFAATYKTGGAIAINLLPHRCQINAPEVVA